MNRKIAAILAAAALALSLGACSDDPEAAPAPTVTITEEAPAPSVEPGGPVADQAFVATMRQQFPYDTAGVSDDEIILLGETTCTMIGQYNGDIAGLLNYLTSPPDAVDAEFAAFTIGASVPAYCPQYLDEVNAFIDGAGGYGSDA
jgi:hypothetical protein